MRRSGRSIWDFQGLRGGLGRFWGRSLVFNAFIVPIEGFANGNVVGGAFAESSATWRWGFYINLCVGALFAPVYLFLVPSKDPRPTISTRARLSNIDFVGLALLAGSTTALILAICFGRLDLAVYSLTFIDSFQVASHSPGLRPP